MRQIFGVLLVVTVAMSGAFRAQAQNGSKELVLDVYSVKVPSDVAQEKGFELWRESLYAGGANSGEHSPVIHQIYQLDGVVTIDQHQGTGEGSEPQISVVGSVTPEQEDAEYNVEFSELGRPPVYEGKMTLRIRPKEIRVWRLPALELEQGQLDGISVLKFINDEQVKLFA
jgi:hypothetical protein